MKKLAMMSATLIAEMVKDCMKQNLTTMMVSRTDDNGKAQLITVCEDEVLVSTFLKYGAINHRLYKADGTLIDEYETEREY